MPDATDTDDTDPTTPSSSEPTTTSISETMEPTAPTNPTDPTGETGGGVCGDGEVEGDEACDDGVNDGAYGGCMPDCSALAERCGDNTVNGPEACDDGVNDNAYGGCATDCSAFGPYCGDGEVQDEQEMCDNGEANANGSGCNVDCVTSGALLFEFEVTLGNTCWGWADPVTRGEDVLLAYYRDCDQVWTFLELSPELEEVDSTDALLSTYPYRTTVRGTDWLLGAYDCDILVTEDGEVTEVCDPDRISGGQAIAAVDDQIYIALKNDTIAQWGATSPSDGDVPDWTALAPADGASYSYYFSHATPGALGSVTGAGQYGSESGGNWTYQAFVQRFNSAGNSVNSNYFTELENIYEIHDSPTGALVGLGYSPDGNDLIRLNANLNFTWVTRACTNGTSDFVVDSQGQIVVDCGAEPPARNMRKLDDDGNELWSVEIENDPYDATSGQLAVDSTDHIIRTSYVYDSLVPEYRFRVEKFAP